MKARCASGPTSRTIVIFDDGLHARGFSAVVLGSEVRVFEHADDAVALCSAMGAGDWVFMDYAMGAAHQTGESAVAALRKAGFRGRIVAMSSDPSANERMIAAGASESIEKRTLDAFLRRMAPHG